MLDIGKLKFTKLRILLDLGASSTILLGKYLTKRHQCVTAPMTWSAQGAQFQITGRSNVDFYLPEWHTTNTVTWNCYIDDYQACHWYDIIIECDLQSALQMNLDFSNHVVKYNACKVSTAPLKDIDTMNFSTKATLADSEILTLEEIWESRHVQNTTERARWILDAHF